MAGTQTALPNCAAPTFYCLEMEISVETQFLAVAARGAPPLV